MRTLSVAFVLMLVSGAATAHSELPQEDWCEGGQMVPVVSIKVPAHTLVTRGEMCRAEPPVAQNKECGQFDDDYDLTKSAADGICQSLGFRGTEGGDVGSVIFIADWPSTFLDPAHHDIFELRHSLSGYCVRCEALRVIVPSPR